MRFAIELLNCPSVLNKKNILQVLTKFPQARACLKFAKASIKWNGEVSLRQAEKSGKSVTLTIA